MPKTTALAQSTFSGEVQPGEGSSPRPAQADPGTAALVAENALLRKQLAKAELHAVILKKALAIVGQEPREDLK